MDIDGNIVYDLIDGKQKKRKVPLLIFTKDITYIHKKWVESNQQMLEVCRPNKKGERTVSYCVFKALKPSWCVHRKYLCLMHCDHCTEFDWKREALDDILKSNHDTKCNGCNLCTLLSTDSFRLVDELLCDYGDGSPLDQYCSLPTRQCVNNECKKCERNQYDVILSNDTITNNPLVKYTYFDEIKSETKEGKTTKMKIQRYKQQRWNEFKNDFLRDLKTHLLHTYEVKQQLYSRRYISKRLGKRQLFISVDFIGNIKCSGSIFPNSRKVLQLQLYVIYEIDVVNSDKIESVSVYLSDESRKGACSALVFLNKYIKRKKTKYFAKHSEPLEQIFIWGDRGSGDQWNADWLAHSAELAFVHQVQLLTATLPGGHNKWLHDAFGNVAKSASLRGLLGDIVNFGPDESPCKTLCDWLNDECGLSLDGTKKYEYIYVPADEVPPRYSNIETLKIGPNDKGVKSFHTARADKDGNSILYAREIQFCF